MAVLSQNFKEIIRMTLIRNMNLNPLDLSLLPCQAHHSGYKIKFEGLLLKMKMFKKNIRK